MSLVTDHLAKPSSYVETLQEQIRNGMYAHLFAGKPHDLVFLDIGANIGLVSLYAVPFCKRIAAVEPSPEVFPVLKENTKDYETIECYQYALAPENEPVQFFLNDINSTASSTVNTYGTLTKVEGRTLETILRDAKLDHVDVCKVDCEGGEGDSLSYEQLIAAKDIIKTFFIETHNCPKSTWEYKMGVLVEHFCRIGYYKQTIDGMALTASLPWPSFIWREPLYMS